MSNLKNLFSHRFRGFFGNGWNKEKKKRKKHIDLVKIEIKKQMENRNVAKHRGPREPRQIRTFPQTDLKVKITWFNARVFTRTVIHELQTHTTTTLPFRRLTRIVPNHGQFPTSGNNNFTIAIFIITR